MGKSACRADHTGPLEDQRENQVPEAVGIAERNEGEVRVVRSDPHRGANLAAVGLHLGVGCAERLRGAAGAARHLDEALPAGGPPRPHARDPLKPAAPPEERGPDGARGADLGLLRLRRVDRGGNRTRRQDAEEDLEPLGAVWNRHDDPGTRGRRGIRKMLLRPPLGRPCKLGARPPPPACAVEEGRRRRGLLDCRLPQPEQGSAHPATLAWFGTGAARGKLRLSGGADPRYAPRGMGVHDQLHQGRGVARGALPAKFLAGADLQRLPSPRARA